MPCTLSRFGSLVMNENQPSTSPLASGVGSNWAGTSVMSLGLMSLAFRKAFHTGSLTDCTPIFLPIMACGLGSGFDASDITQKGFFWKRAPTAMSLLPLLTMPEAVMSGAEMPTKAPPESTTASWVTLGPPEMRLTFEKPWAV